MTKTLRDRLTANQSQTAPVSKLLGMRIVSRGRGQAILRMKIKNEHLNTIGTVHGGILCDISDAAMGHAFMTLLKKDKIGMTIEFKINFLKPVFTSDTVIATAKVLLHGKTISYVECELHNNKGQLVAKASDTCKTL